MEDYEKELQTLCNELEKLGGFQFQCYNRYFGLSLDGEITYKGFDVYYLGEPVFRIKIEGYDCRKIYDDRKILNKLLSKISKQIKLLKMNRKLAEIEGDFT